ncbi:hypothetical protein SORBI_3002G009100 [Sorghum bicolor]|uniref:Uncharacterized protein n=1 Tax=Sorghum bicolor TaxID=4558 RepID=A0A1W0W1Q2_SORBI|nr:hypothetical protein SORBI_3002G009100 [Sorghum bicolor]
MIRRFVNLVAEKYKCGEYSLHRLDVSKHLFHQSRADARMEEQLYIMHGGGGGGGGGHELNFDVLRYAPPLRRPWSKIKAWYWQPLPVPPPPFFVDDDQSAAVISGYTVVDGGKTICLSSDAEGAIGTYYLNDNTLTVIEEGKRTYFLNNNIINTMACCEWKRAGDWVLPFTGKAEYIPDLDLWLGFSLHSPGYLCAASNLSDMHKDHRPMSSPIVWPDNTPKEWMTVNAKLLSLGSGKFAVAKVFKAAVRAGLFSERDTVVEDEVLVLTGVELEFRGKEDNNNSLRGLKLLQHKSICYTCANGTAIRYVL